MGLARIHSAVVVGVTARLISVEVHIAGGLPGLILVGLPDAAVNESRDRVRAAIVNCCLRWPDRRITVGLSPAWLPKRGPGLDLAIALAVLAADGQVPNARLGGVMALGELGLDGSVRPVSGALAAALAVDRGRVDRVITGCEDAVQARLVPDLAVTGVSSLAMAVSLLRADAPAIELTPEGLTHDGFSQAGDPDRRDGVPQGGRSRVSCDLSEIKGQPQGKRALEVAAAGGHNMALLGRAGVGKTLLAERLVDLIPDLDERASLEVTSIHQLAGKSARSLVARPPYLAPHHTATRAAMVGGGSELRPTIGLVSLAHRGVMFLDEAAEFEPSVLDALREPIDAGSITVARSGFQVTLPAQVQILLATNPCPCGHALDASTSTPCRCTAGQRRRYLGRLSGPLMDRIDIRVVLHRPTIAQLRRDAIESESTVNVAARVAAARAAASTRRQKLAERQQEPAVGSGMADALLGGAARRRLEVVCATESLRGRERVARVAWTLADLGGRTSPCSADIDEAADLRVVDDSWAAV